MSDYQTQRHLAYQRDKGRCVVCLSAGEQTHHRQGRRGKDPHRLSNLITCCSDCHRRIHAAPAAAYEAGWMVRKHGLHTTETEPVRYGDLMVVLTNERESS